MNYKRFAALFASLLTVTALTACEMDLGNSNPIPKDVTTPTQATLPQDPVKPDEPDTTDIEPVDIDPTTDTDPVTIKTDYIIPDMAEKVYSDEQLKEASAAYAKYMEQVYNDNVDYSLDGVTFMPIRTNASNLMDLAYCTGTAHADSVTICRYDFDSKKVIEIGNFGSYASLTFCPKMNLIHDGYYGMGYLYSEYFYINENNEKVSLQEFEDNFGLFEDLSYVDNDEIEANMEANPDAYCRIDGVDVTYREYAAAQKYWDDIFNDSSSTIWYGDMIKYGVGYNVSSYVYYYEDNDYNAALSAYTDTIKNAPNNMAYNFINIASSNLPALVMSAGSDENDTVILYQYSTSDNTVYEIGEYGDYGSMRYLAGYNLFLDDYIIGLAGYSDYYSLNTYPYMNATPVISFTADCIDMDQPSEFNYYINDCLVDESFYDMIIEPFSFEFNYATYEFMNIDRSKEQIAESFEIAYDGRY